MADRAGSSDLTYEIRRSPAQEAERQADAAPGTAQANASESAVRSAVKHIFARQKGPIGLFIRTIGIARARTKIGLANPKVVAGKR